MTEIDLMAATPSEFDTVYAEKLREYQTAKARASQALESLHHYVDDPGTLTMRPRRHRQFTLSAGETLDRARAGEFAPAYNRAPGERALVSYDAAKALSRELNEKLSAMDAAYVARGRWSRFWLVPGGHIHSSMSCSTCNKNGQVTDFGWLPPLSGLTEAEAVKEHGAILCTVCFPSAPVEWTNGLELAAQARKAAQCEGSRKLPGASARPYARYQPCSVCGSMQSVTSTGLIRAHKAAGK